MGRCKVISLAATEEPHQSKSKKKRNGSNAENTAPVNTGQGLIDGKGALYHCNYCNKDISGTIRIKCVLCPDFDLCVECFSVGAEVTPHKSNHPYRVMDNLSFPLLCQNWNADEEMLLLEGIEMYGFGNWNEVAEHVGTKTKSSCIDHYNTVYMNSPCFPLPDMSQVVGKGREELLAEAQRNADMRRETVGEQKVKEESDNSASVKAEEVKKENMAHQSSSNLTAGSAMGSSSNITFPGAVKKASMVQSNDEIKAEESQSDRRIGEKKPRISGEEGPSVTELSGYNFKREEYEIEYDNDAEQLLADLEFKDTDTDTEHELKVKMLHIYSKRLDERKRRKEFILERNLLNPDDFTKNLPPDERRICQHYRVFMRFHSKEAHEELLKNLLADYRLAKRIKALKEARFASCRTADEADRYIEQMAKVTAKTGPSTQPDGKESDTAIAGQSSFSASNNWDVTGFGGADLLSETEKQLCSELRILPSHYLKLLQALSVEILNGNVKKKSDAYHLFQVNPRKVDRIYDMLVFKGIAQA